MSPPINTIQSATKNKQPQLINFTQRIVQTPSMPGQEQDIAHLIQQEMVQLGYDETWVDEAGNVVGKIKGGNGPTVLLNGHMDHVDPGPVEGWPYPPFSGQIVKDELWGRGSVDMKGPVACMLYGAVLLKTLDVAIPGDILMTVPVMEEVGGLGTRFLATYLQADVAICGEPSRNTLRRGHRGRVELEITFKGKSAHASIPTLGINPHYDAAQLLLKLPQLPMAYDDGIGYSSVVPTLYQTDQTSPNVNPGEVRLTLDWRNVASDPPERILQTIEELLNEINLQSQPSVSIAQDDFVTYTNMKDSMPSIFPSFLMPQEHPFIQTASHTIQQVTGRAEAVDIWQFATDGGHLMAAGIPTIGFGPGDERLAHTNQERIALAQMEEAMAVYTALILALAEVA